MKMGKGGKKKPNGRRNARSKPGKVKHRKHPRAKALREVEQLAQKFKAHPKLWNPHPPRTPYVMGIDDAGRCPVVGSLYLAGVLIPEPLIQMASWKEAGIRDSKKVAPKDRPGLAKLVRRCFPSTHVEIPPWRIAEPPPGYNLNDLEAWGIARIIKKLLRLGTTVSDIVVNNPDTTPWRMKERLKRWLPPDVLEIVSLKHNNEDEDPPVAAASIVATHLVDLQRERLNKRIGKFRSGNSCDPVTTEFVARHAKHKIKSGDAYCEGCRWIRWNWATAQRALQCAGSPEAGGQRLEHRACKH